tara:strand:+ start:262 stop:555 length:294 start_codon:yes stop_codon:yes gene_type:complete
MASTIKVNTIQDAGGNSLLVSDGSGSITTNNIPAFGTATGDGSTTAFTINSGRAVANVLAIVNGIVLVPTADYTISGTTLTFQTAPASSAEIQFRYL